MKISVIAPMGTSPPVVTEFLQYLVDGRNVSVNDVTMICTNDEQVLKSAILAEAGMLLRYSQVRTHIARLPFSDIESQERSIEFTKIAIRILKEQRQKYNVDSIFLCIAGGRKEACVILSIIAQFFDVSGVYHIVSPDVKYANLELERARHDIDKLYQAEDKAAYYGSKKEIFDKLLFPPPSSYNVIPIPIFPIKKQYLKQILDILKSQNRSLKELDYYLLMRLEHLDLIKVVREKIYVKEGAHHMIDIINEVLD